MAEEEFDERNLFSIFVGAASRLVNFRGGFAAEKETDQDEANKAWNEFVRAFDSLKAEFAEEMRLTVIESNEYDELPGGKFIRRKTVFDEEILETK